MQSASCAMGISIHIRRNLSKVCSRHLTSSRQSFPQPNTLVVISESDSVYENLSVEDWLYENKTLSPGQRLLFIYRNRPCVVIGKFQNQWVEANLSYMSANSIQLGKSCKSVSSCTTI